VPSPTRFNESPPRRVIHYAGFSSTAVPSPNSHFERYSTIRCNRWLWLVCLEMVRTYVGPCGGVASGLLIIECVLCRPLNDAGQRVPPSELCSHRLSHRFLGPCCLCPVTMEGEITFTEAAIFMATSGHCTGHYIARCARGNCGYFGKPYSYPPRLVGDPKASSTGK
jgi:hypothetical protein